MIETGLAAARWLQFAAAMLLFGIPAFALYGMTRETRHAERKWLRRLNSAAVVAGFIAALLLLIAESAEMSGVPALAINPCTIWSVLSGTYFGEVWIVRLVLLVVLAIIVFLPRAIGVGWIAFVGFATTVSLAWQGHGSDGGVMPGLVHQAADVIHLIAASMWIGALVALVHLLGVAHRNADNSLAALRGLERFSGIGGLVVAVLLASGIANTWALTAPRPLLESIATPYAWVLGAKLALFILMLALAALNRFHLTPQLAQTLGKDADIGQAVKVARRGVVIETALAAFVLVAVSALGVMEPPNAG